MGTFNQSLQYTQDVFVGFQAPSPPVWVMSPTRRQGVFPFVETLDFTQEPTGGQLDDWTTPVLSEDQRPDDRMLHVSHEKYSVQ